MKCETCSKFEGILLNEELERKYDRCTKMADSLVKLGLLEIISGDCELDVASFELGTEKHFTVSHYLECKSCNQTFYIGGCIRGKPKFKVGEPIPDTATLKRAHWGNIGIAFTTQT